LSLIIVPALNLSQLPPLSIVFFIVIHDTSFFEDKFGVTAYKGTNDPQVHMIIYLQVAIISQALIFVTRSHGFCFTERPSVALMLAFCLAQLVSSIIAAFGDWGFTQVQSISGGWIGIVWVWNIVWFFPLDFVKFGMKFTVIKSLQARKARKIAAALPEGADGAPIRRTTSRHESLYSNRTNFITRAMGRVGLQTRSKIEMSPKELTRFSSIQAQQSGAALQRSASRV
jgi:H+-transporting ATPase